MLQHRGFRLFDTRHYKTPSIEVTMAISGVLLVFNAVFCISLYFGFVSQLDDAGGGVRRWLESSAVSQLFMFVTPVLILAIQWLLFDAFRDHFSNRNSRDRR